MKVKKIFIKKFHQFENLEIDLTYPPGHELEAKPLQRVCFIGQSGTGKTKLLDFIAGLTHNAENFQEKYGSEHHSENYISIENFELSYNQSINESNADSNYTITNQKRSNKRIAFEKFNLIDAEYILQGRPNLIIFPAELKMDLLNANVIDQKDLADEHIIDFSVEDLGKVWDIVLLNIQKYQEEILHIRQEVSKTLEDSIHNLDLIKIQLKQLEKLQKSSSNPLKDLADNCLDKILKPFNLKVKTDVDFKQKDDLGFIKIIDNKGNDIPYNLWSTGTKQIVLSTIPLYLLKPKNSIVLFDEPERSLYPDLQRIFIDHLISFSIDSQFFFATHSPVIASNFDPWEIVELKFDSHGKIYREIYFEGDNHINNYKLNPKLMRWDDILQRIFDLENDGSVERRKRLDKLALLNVQYRKLQRQGKSETVNANAMAKEIEILSKELSNWN